VETRKTGYIPAWYAISCDRMSCTKRGVPTNSKPALRRVDLGSPNVGQMGRAPARFDFYQRALVDAPKTFLAKVWLKSSKRWSDYAGRLPSRLNVQPAYNRTSLSLARSEKRFSLGSVSKIPRRRFQSTFLVAEMASAAERDCRASATVNTP